MSNPLDKVIELIQLTGDNCIILDSAGNPAYVVSRFDKYQKNALNSLKTANLSENIVENSIIPNSDHKMVEPSPFSDDNSLTYAKNDDPVDNSEDKYYFEPID